VSVWDRQYKDQVQRRAPMMRPSRNIVRTHWIAAKSLTNSLVTFSVTDGFPTASLLGSYSGQDGERATNLRNSMKMPESTYILDAFQSAINCFNAARFADDGNQSLRSEALRLESQFNALRCIAIELCGAMPKWIPYLADVIRHAYASTSKWRLEPRE